MNLQELGFNGIGTLDTETAAQIVNNTFSTNEVAAYVGEEIDAVEIETSVVERNPRLHLRVGFGANHVEIEANNNIRELVPFTTNSLYAMIGRLSPEGFNLLMEENHVNTTNVNSVFDFIEHQLHDFYEFESYIFHDFLDPLEIYHYVNISEDSNNYEPHDNFYYHSDGEGGYLPLPDYSLDEIVALFYDEHIANATIKGGVQYV